MPTDIKQHFLQEAKYNKKQITEKANHALNLEHSPISFEDYMLVNATAVNNAEARKKSGQKKAEKYAPLKRWVLSEANAIRAKNPYANDNEIAKKIIEQRYRKLPANKQILAIGEEKNTIYTWIHNKK